jgi:hypothetical protein
MKSRHVTRVAELQGDSAEDTQLLKHMAVEAETYLRSFDWCKSVAECYFGVGIGGVVAVFLVDLEAADEKADSALWVVVGDLPPAYLVTEDIPDPISALWAYVAEMKKWVDAVKNGKSTDDVIPVNAPATAENANRLASRLSILEKEIIPLLQGRMKQAPEQ